MSLFYQLLLVSYCYNEGLQVLEDILHAQMGLMDEAKKEWQPIRGGMGCVYFCNLPGLLRLHPYPVNTLYRTR